MTRDEYTQTENCCNQLRNIIWQNAHNLRTLETAEELQAIREKLAEWEAELAKTQETS